MGIFSKKIKCLTCPDREGAVTSMGKCLQYDCHWKLDVVKCHYIIGKDLSPGQTRVAESYGSNQLMP
jgi:hypothetical protein